MNSLPLVELVELPQKDPVELPASGCDASEGACPDPVEAFRAGYIIPSCGREFQRVFLWQTQNEPVELTATGFEGYRM